MSTFSIFGASASSSEAWRATLLERVPAAVRFLSVEPLLGPIDRLPLSGIHWVIVGGESGHYAREMKPDWARSIRDQCRSASVALFFKQGAVYGVSSLVGNSAIICNLNPGVGQRYE